MNGKERRQQKIPPVLKKLIYFNVKVVLDCVPLDAIDHKNLFEKE